MTGIARNGWNWLEWLKMADNSWKCLDDWNALTWQDIAGNGWKWLEMAKMDENR